MDTMSYPMENLMENTSEIKDFKGVQRIKRSSTDINDYKSIDEMGWIIVEEFC